MLALALLLVAAFAQGSLSFQLTGGLFQDFAPSAFHLQHALLPLLRHMGLHADLRILRPGYVPRGGGSLALTVEPAYRTLRPLLLRERGEALRYWGLALASHLQQRQVSQRMATACQQVLYRRGVHAEFRLLNDTTAPQAGAASPSLPRDRTHCLGPTRLAHPVVLLRPLVGLWPAPCWTIWQAGRRSTGIWLTSLSSLRRWRQGRQCCACRR